ncbi:unnamed protein product [Ectocarpus sp. 12 AP-2014]
MHTCELYTVNTRAVSAVPLFISVFIDAEVVHRQTPGSMRFARRHLSLSPRAPRVRDRNSLSMRSRRNTPRFHPLCTTLVGPVVLMYLPHDSGVSTLFCLLFFAPRLYGTTMRHHGPLSFGRW